MNYLPISKEQTTANLIKSMVKSNKIFKLVGSYTNVLDAVSVIKHKNVDVIFLDAMIENINRLDFFKYLPNSPHLIFIYTHSEIINYFKLNIGKNQLYPIPKNNFHRNFINYIIVK